MPATTLGKAPKLVIQKLGLPQKMTCLLHGDIGAGVRHVGAHWIAG